MTSKPSMNEDITFNPTDRVVTDFAIFSDNMLAAEELQSCLADFGHRAQVIDQSYDRPIDCLITLRREPLLLQSEIESWLELINNSSLDVMIGPELPSRHSEYETSTWHASGLRMRWDGDLRRLRDSSKLLGRYVPSLASCKSHLPIVVRSATALATPYYCDNRDTLVSALSKNGIRLIFMNDEFFANFLSRQRSDNRLDYDISRVLQWGSSELSRAFVPLRIANANVSQSPFPGPGLSLHDVIQDRRASSLVLLLGEPGAGKSRQLRYLDARCALDSLTGGDRENILRSFHVALAEQASVPDISVNWLESRWRSVVNVEEWCDFDAFLSDGGVLLLDGFNEGTKRAIPLDEWMMRWRDVVAEIFERGAQRIVVTCRTRDQLIPLRSARGEEPTSIAVAPLSIAEIEGISLFHSLKTAIDLIADLKADSGLIPLYSNPFSLDSYLTSDTLGVPRSDCRIQGLRIAAAIAREREQLNFHGPLIPERSAAALSNVIRQEEPDPWPILSEMPLIRALGAFARELTLPSASQRAGRSGLSLADARRTLAESLERDGVSGSYYDVAIEAARDLYILSESLGPTDSAVRFAHPTVQELFAALGCSDAEVIRIVASDPSTTERASVADGRPSAESEHASPAQSRMRKESLHAELARFSCELKGDDFLRSLANVDAALAAQSYTSSGIKRSASLERHLKNTLLRALEADVEYGRRDQVLSALGELNWHFASWNDGLHACTTKVPTGEWSLGFGNASDEHYLGERGRVLASEPRQIRIPTFLIQRFPITNYEYEYFIRDGGYEERSLWTLEGWEWRTRSGVIEGFVNNWSLRRDILRKSPGQIISLLREGKATPTAAAALVRLCEFSDSDLLTYARRSLEHSITHPRFWQSQVFSGPLQPVVGVSWFEANAYCEWLSRRIGSKVRLPSEDEWEAACWWSESQFAAIEAMEELRLPRANTVEMEFNRTTPVGTFATKTQVAAGIPAELLGNCFEWVFDSYRPGDHIRKIVKGGSWRHEAWRACGQYRGRGDVGTQNDDVGFRCVVECDD